MCLCTLGDNNVQYTVVRLGTRDEVYLILTISCFNGSSCHMTSMICPHDLSYRVRGSSQWSTVITNRLFLNFNKNL